MDRKYKVLSVAIAVLLLLGAGAVYFKSVSAQAEGQVVGFVDSEAILANYPEAVQVNQELSSLRKASEDELHKKVQEKYGVDNLDSLPDESKLAIQKMVEDADGQYQKKILDLKSQKWDPIVNKVNDSIKQVGQAKGVQVVLEKAAVVYGGIDLTDEVISKLKAK